MKACGALQRVAMQRAVCCGVFRISHAKRDELCDCVACHRTLAVQLMLRIAQCIGERPAALCGRVSRKLPVAARAPVALSGKNEGAARGRRAAVDSLDQLNDNRAVNQGQRRMAVVHAEGKTHWREHIALDGRQPPGIRAHPSSVGAYPVPRLFCVCGRAVKSVSRIHCTKWNGK